MSLLQDYSACLESIRELKVQFRELEKELIENSDEIEEVANCLEGLREREESPEASIEREIERRIRSLQEKRTTFLGETDEKFASVESEFRELCSKTEEEARNGVFGKSTLKKLERKVKSIESLMESFQIDVVESPTLRAETMESLSRRVKKFNSVYDEYSSIPKSTVEKSVDALTLHGVLSKCNNPQVSVLLQSLYVGLLATVFIGAPFVVLLGYLGVNAKELQSFLKLKRIEEKLIRCFLEVKASINCVHESMASEVRLRCDELLEDKRHEYDTKISKMREDREYFLKKYEEEEQRIEALREDEAFKEEFRSKVPEEIERQESEKAELEEKSERIKEDLECCQGKINEAEQNLSTLREQIESKYLSLTLGEERLLTPELFLGFNEDTEELITFNHNCDSVLVYYLPPQGNDTPDSVNDFILMIMVQLLCTLESPSVEFRVFNDFSGNRPYAPFTNEKLSGIVSVLTDSSEMQREFKTLRAEVVTRTSTIGKRADDIQSFNKLMIESKSLPLPYVFVVCHSLPVNCFNDSNLLFTLREGPRVGIIPIVFVSMNKLKSSLMENKTEECKKYYNLVSSFKSKAFQFDSVSGKLITCPDAQSDSLKFELEKVIKSRGRR